MSVEKKILTKDEEADEIIRRLSTKPSNVAVAQPTNVSNVTTKIYVDTQVVTSKSRHLKSKWTCEPLAGDWMYKEKEPETKLPLTEEQEADEIVRRLSTPPKKPPTLEDELMKEMADIIQKEIDHEILRELRKYAKRED